jgi:hypothetical protein
VTRWGRREDGRSEPSTTPDFHVCECCLAIRHKKAKVPFFVVISTARKSFDVVDVGDHHASIDDKSDLDGVLSVRSD